MAHYKVEICGINTSKLPLLSNEEKKTLFDKIKKGDKKAREAYIHGNLRLVLSIIQRFNNSTENVDDLFQIGCIGLMKAIDNFDVTQNVKFSTYAVPMIIGEVRRYLRDNNAIRVSRSLRDTAYKAIYAKEALMKKQETEPTLEEISKMIDVPPTWLKKLQEKCSNEPDRYHIVFFDEITNALPSIQGIAFNIVLDREVNGIWKLPENARIVAAGNDMKDSLAANQLAEPLFNRFAHVYIKTTTQSWLNWASENNIHPAIYTFIAYKKGTVLRSEYDGEKPNADPRKWEMASKMLYSTRNPEMLRALVGEDITREFVAFCNQEVITLDDVLNGNYNYRDIDYLNTAERYATIIGLTQVDEENLEKVRDFAINLGKEFGAIFDSLWVHGDESRLEKLAEIKLASGGLSRK